MRESREMASLELPTSEIEVQSEILEEGQASSTEEEEEQLSPDHTTLLSVLGEAEVASLLNRIESGEMSEIDLEEAVRACRASERNEAMTAERVAREYEEAERAQRFLEFRREEARQEVIRLGQISAYVHEGEAGSIGDGEEEGESSQPGIEIEAEDILEPDEVEPNPGSSEDLQAALEAHEIAMAVARVHRAEATEAKSPRRGLAKHVMARLPRYPFVRSPCHTPVHQAINPDELDLAALESESADDVSYCVICQDFYEESEELLVLPCFHRFHSDCVDPWLESHHTCPTCNMDVASENFE